MQLRIVQSYGNRLGLACGRLCLLRVADRARDESASPCTAVGSAELERKAAPVVDPLAVDLLLPADGAMKGGLGIQLRELHLVGAGVDRIEHGVLEGVIVEVERVRVGDLAPQPGAPGRNRVELDCSPQEADLF